DPPTAALPRSDSGNPRSGSEPRSTADDSMVGADGGGWSMSLGGRTIGGGGTSSVRCSDPDDTSRDGTGAIRLTRDDSPHRLLSEAVRAGGVSADELSR